VNKLTVIAMILRIVGGERIERNGRSDRVEKWKCIDFLQTSEASELLPALVELPRFSNLAKQRH
jgi:hypothetical protein